MSYSYQQYSYFLRKISVFFFLLSSVFFSSSLAYAAISTIGSEQNGITTSGTIAYVGAGTSDNANGCGNITPTIPAGSNGDLLLAVVTAREEAASATVSITSETWNTYYSATRNNMQVFVFYRIADGTEGASATVNQSGTCNSILGQISRFSGVDNNNPFETSPITGTNVVQQNSGNLDTGTETTTSANAMTIVAGFISNDRTIDNGDATGDGYTESFDTTQTAGRDSAISLHYQLETTAGNKSIANWDLSGGGTNQNYGVIFALKPSGLTIDVPAGTTTGHVMVAGIAVRPSTTVIGAPSGWTLIRRTNQGTGNTNAQALYYRVATASEPSSYTWTFSGGAIGGAAGGIISYSGVDTTNPIDVDGGNTTASSTSHTANSITTTVANTMLISSHSYSSAQNWTEPSGMTEQVDIFSTTPTPSGGGISISMSDETIAAVGATGTRVATSGDNDTGVAQMVALTPFAVTGTITANFSANLNAINAGSISITNASFGDPEASATSTSTGAATITTNITTLTNNAWVIDTAGSGNGGTYSPGAGQTERWDTNIGSATAAMTTKELATAGLTSMSQTHSTTSNRSAHTVISVAPLGTSTIGFDAAASTNTTNATSISWSHSLSTTNTANTKLIVGIGFEEGGACNDTIDSVTYGNIQLTQVAQAQVASGGNCQQVEIWYADLTNIIVSTDGNSNLGGQAMDQDEAVEYDIANDSGSLFFDEASIDSNSRLDALHQFANGNVAMSVANNGRTIDGNAVPNGSVALLTPSGTAGVYDFSSILFAESNFASGDETVDAVYVRDNGNIVLSTAGNASLTGIGAFDDDDIVEWNPNTNTASLIFNIASITGAATNWDVDGVHFLNDNENLILFSLYNDRTIGPTTYENGDVLLYNRNTSTLSIYFSEDNFTGDEDVDALTLAVVVVENQVDHYEITFPNGAIGVTCEASQITITAHDTGDNAVNVSGGTVLTINAYIDGTTTNTGTLDNATGGGTLAGNPGNPVTYTWPSGTEESSVTLELRQLTAETIDIDLSDTNGDSEKGDGDNSDTEDPEIEFRDAIFRVVDSTPAAVDITTKLSGKQSNTTGIGFQDLYLQAIETVSATECQGVFESENNVTVEMAFECDNPTACETVNVEVEDDSAVLQSIASNPNGSVSSYTGVQFDFDADSKTPLRFVYDDAGRITLHARYDIDPSGATVYMSGESGPSGGFLVKPAGICVESLDANSTCPSADPDNADCSTPFRKAGNVDAENFFNLTVRGVTWENDSEANTDFCSGNTTTPNFELSTIALSPNLVAPGGSNTTLGVVSIDIVNADKGTKTDSNQSVDEVGVFTITATPPSYLGETISASTSANIGRFYPDRFNVTMDNSPAFADSCSGFTYQDQTFYYGTAPILEITALNSDGNTTNNYGGSFWRLTSSLLNRDYSDGSAVAPNASLFPNTTVTGGVTLAGDSDFDGVGTLSLTSGMSGDSFIYQKGAPESAFDADVDVTFLVAAFQDTDHSAPNPVCYDLANDGTCDSFTHSTMQGTELRWGRMVLGNGFGSELLAIEVPISVEYFGADDFEVNTLDTCTTYDSSDMSFSNEDGVTLGNLTLSGSGTMVSGNDDPANSILASSTANETGSADVTIDLTAQDWLQFDWDNDTNHDNDPTSRITWGIFSGSDELIYIREPW